MSKALYQRLAVPVFLAALFSAAFSAAAEAAFTPVVVAEHGFEKGNFHGWVTRGGMGRLIIITAAAHGGSSSLQIMGRTVDWHCPRVELTKIMDGGGKFKVEIWVRPAPGEKPGTMSMSMLTRYQDKDVEAQIGAELPVTDAAWSKLEGEFVMDPAAAGAFLYVFFKSNPTASYFVDDLKVTKIGAAQAAAASAPLESHVYDFEKGGAQGWIPRGTVSLEVTAAAAKEGSYGMRASGRGENWSGPSLKLLSTLKKGAVYEISGFLRLEKAPASPSTVKFTMEEKPSGKSTGWKTIGESQVKDIAWVTLSGRYSFTDAMDDLVLYAESSAPSDVIYIDNVKIVMTASPPPAPAFTLQNVTPLKLAFRTAFGAGAAVTPLQLKPGIAADALKKHFTAIVAENAMKWDYIEPQEGQFFWDDADAIVKFAQDNSMRVRFHTLEWHTQVPPWLFLDAGGKDMVMETDPAKRKVNKELLLKRLTNHVTTIVSRYKDRIWAWDVVNEVVDANGPEGMRNNEWYKICGKDYVETAFRAARAAGGPNAVLVINDYSTHDPAKRDALARLIKELQAKGIKVDGVGHQMHVNIDAPSAALIADSIRLFGQMGLDNQITEMDVSVYPDDVTAYTKVPEELIVRQGWRYKELFDAFFSLKDYISVVTFWGIADNYTWLHNRPIPRRDAPFVFDEQFQVKPAYWGIADPSKLPVLIQSLGSPKAEPVVDGAEDLVWSSLPWTAARNGSGPAVSFKTLWTDKRLYVLANIADASLDTADSLAVYLDCGDRTASVQRPEVIRASFTRAGAGPAGTEVKAGENMGGWFLEASLPFPAAVASGRKVGFDLRAGDTAKTAAVTSWNDSKHGQDKDASRYGTLTLKDAVKLAQAAPGTPKIDAVIEDMWNTARPIQTDVVAKGSQNATAKVRMLWDARYLYVLYEVTDPLLNKDSVNAYEQDSIEVFIDENNAKSTEYQADDGQYRVGYENAQSFGSNGSDARFASAARRTETGYVVEAAVPLKTVIGESGMAIGFDAQVNDADASGKRISILKWNDPTDNSYRNTSGFGCLVFAAR